MFFSDGVLWYKLFIRRSSPSCCFYGNPGLVDGSRYFCLLSEVLGPWFLSSMAQVVDCSHQLLQLSADLLLIWPLTSDCVHGGTEISYWALFVMSFLHITCVFTCRFTFHYTEALFISAATDITCQNLFPVLIECANEVTHGESA